MFYDYYGILEVEATATPSEIKLAFKRQALKWHPDKNPGKDTTNEMQAINEAYLILKDPEARERFDIQYQKYQDFQKEKESMREGSSRAERSNARQTDPSVENQGFQMDDDILRRWTENARRQAVDLAKQSIEDFKGMAKAGAKAAIVEGGSQLIFQIMISLVILAFFAMIKSCN